MTSTATGTPKASVSSAIRETQRETDHSAQVSNNHSPGGYVTTTPAHRYGPGLHLFPAVVNGVLVTEGGSAQSAALTAEGRRYLALAEGLAHTQVRLTSTCSLATHLLIQLY